RLDAADLDHAVAAEGVQAGGFGIEDDFPHGGIYPPAWSPRQARMSRTCLSVVDRSAPVSITKSARRRFSASDVWRSRMVANFSALIPGRSRTRARWTSSGAVTTTTLSNSVSLPVSNNKGISNRSADAS